MADKVSVGKLTWRADRPLLPPLLFAMFVIVPPQSYYQIVEYVAAHPGTALTIDNFWVRYVTASGHWCTPDGCLITPTWNHMWFVAYLLFYTLVLAGSCWSGGRLGEHIQAGAEWLLKGVGLILWPILFLGLCAPRSTRVRRDPRPGRRPLCARGVVLAFLLGFGLAKSEMLRQR
jgi:glucan biosynthesis protein C